jgi:hypothetical protein
MMSPVYPVHLASSDDAAHAAIRTLDSGALRRIA